jgi:uncharacterized protein (DUF849 family)
VMRSVLPLNTMAIALGMHCRCGNEDAIRGPRHEKYGSVAQVEHLVRISRELGREVASGEDARRIYKIGEQYRDADETLASAGWVPNRKTTQSKPGLVRVA